MILILENFKKLPLFESKKSIFISIVTTILLVYVITKVDFKLLFKAIFYLDFFYFTMLFIISLLIMYLYFLRFNLIINHKKNNFLQYIVTISAGKIIPPRPFGEYIRMLIVKHYYKTNTEKSIYAILLDDLYDVFFPILFTIIASAYLSNNVLLWKLISIFAIIISIIYTIQHINYNLKILKKILGIKIIKQILNKIFYYYKLVISNQKLIIFNSLITIVILFLSSLRMYLIIIFFNKNISFLDISAIWFIANIIANGSMLPGGFGAFEISMMYLLNDFGISENIAITAAFIERFFNIWIFAIIALIYASKVKIKELHETQLKEFLTKMKNKVKNR